jgi:hypothetical protein
MSLYDYANGDPLNNFDSNGRVWYNPVSWNWNAIGSAIIVKGGLGPGLEEDLKVGPVDLAVGGQTTLIGGWSDLAGHNGPYQAAEGKFQLAIGDTKLGPSWGGEYGTDEVNGNGGNIFAKDSSINLEGERKNLSVSSDDWWTVSDDTSVLLVNIGVSIDLKKIYEGITGESKTPVAGKNKCL